ncbi:hypothetical protein L687_12365 [Microbacterium maritypicum MF109]|uniref:Uncharacterized protein n=1 Tax=Microbacterium maritypicum MF109 TaxID=1333857 RepID=T5KWL8_MICMQ|nr:hypothetical protein L687_12365 [Microbacterium maritypicum MF109]
MMRFAHTGTGETILVQDGEHVLIADSCGDPVCACGYAPSPPDARSQLHAASLVSAHVTREMGGHS